jgi:hypothetical protein
MFWAKIGWQSKTPMALQAEMRSIHPSTNRKTSLTTAQNVNS